MLGKFLGALLGAAAVAVPVQSWAAEPPPIEAFGELPDLEDMALSPSGKSIAALSTIRGQRLLLMLDSEMSLKRSFQVGDTKIRSFDWIGDEAVLLVISQTVDLPYGFTSDQMETYSALIIPVADTEETKVVFGDQKSIFDGVFGEFGVRHLDGKWTAFMSGIALSNVGHFLHGRPTLYQVDLGTGRAKELESAATEGRRKDWLIDAHGETAVTFEMLTNSGRWSIRNSQRKELASGQDREGDAGLVALGKNGDTLIFAAQDQETMEIEWYEVPLDGGAAPQVILQDVDIDRLYVDEMTGWAMGYVQGGTEPQPIFFDPEKQVAANKVRRAFAGLEMRISDWTPDLKKALVRTSGNGDSGTWYLVDIANLSAAAVGTERVLLPPAAVGKVSRVEYKAQDGLELDGVLTLPPGREAKNLPIVMFPHGGPSGYDTVEFDWWAQAFASRGYAVFQPNFRGSTNRDEAFRRAGYGQWGRKMQTDISDGLAELAKRGIADPDRACIMGASYGGYASLAGVTLQQGLYQCAVAVAPVSDLALMYWSDYRESGNNKMLRRSLEEELGPRSELGNVSPRRFASQADAPILLIHGKDDTVVKFEHSEKMAEELKSAGKPYEMVVLEKEDHWLSRSETRKQMLAAAMAFVQKYNPADQ